MTEMQMNKVDLDTKKDIADRDRAAREKIEARKDRTTRDVEKRKDETTRIGQNKKMASDALSSLFKVGSTILANDPKWYNKNPSLVKSVANINVNLPLGSVYELDNVVSGFMMLEFCPVLPHTAPSSTANSSTLLSQVDASLVLSMKALYASIRKANSGARNYEYQDLVKYVLAIQSMYVYLAECTKYYNILQTFSSDNMFVGRRLASAYTIEKIRNELPRLKAMIDYYANALSIYALPDDMSVVNRQVWMAMGCFSDNPVSASQFYCFRLHGFYYIKEATDVNLYFKTIDALDEDHTGLTVEKLTNGLELMIQGLVNDPYAAIISGDIQKAYMKSSYLKFQPVEFKPFLPIYSEEVLTQIESATVLPAIESDTDTLIIKQDVAHGTLSQALPYAKIIPNQDAILFDGLESTIVNMYKDAVTPDDIMVATRLNTGLVAIRDESETKLTFKLYPRVTATEIIVHASIFAIGRNPQDGVVGTSGYLSSLMVGYNNGANDIGNGKIGALISTTALNRSNIYLISQFDWHPAYHIISYMSGSSSWRFSPEIRELKRYAEVTYNQIAAMHKVASLSEYGLANF